MSTILVCGGRFYRNPQRVNQILDAAIERLGLTAICHGDAGRRTDDGKAILGADVLADAWARAKGIPSRAYPAQWNDLSQPDAVVRRRDDGSLFDAMAGPRRNQLMLETERPSAVIAFPGGAGTFDMATRADAAGIRVIKVDWGEITP